MRFFITIICTLILFTFPEKFGLIEDALSENTSERAEEIISEANSEATQSIVFIAGFDEGDNVYYKKATEYFESQNLKVVKNLYSLEEIIVWLNEHYNGKDYDEIQIVSHSNAWRGMSLSTTQNGDRITAETLKLASEEKKLPKINKGITSKTKIIFHSCGLGNNEVLLKQLKNVFSSEEHPTVIASPYFNIFGGKYAPHYLAKPYYGYYPTAESSGPLAISKEFKKNYPNEKIDWQNALETRSETRFGEVYTFKFNIPVDWEIIFDSSEHIPQLKDKDAIMDFVSENEAMSKAIYDLEIPIEKFRWRSSIEGKTLYIKGKTTVLCVLQPILNSLDSNEYAKALIGDDTIYNSL